MSRLHRRVYSLYASGLSYGQIAHRLGVKKPTIFRTVEPTHPETGEPMTPFITQEKALSMLEALNA